MNKTWLILFQFEIFLFALLLVFIDRAAPALVGFALADTLKATGLYPALMAAGGLLCVFGLAMVLPVIRRFLISNRTVSYLIPAQVMVLLVFLGMEVLLRLTVFNEPMARIRTNWFGELPAAGTSYLWASEGFSLTKYTAFPAEIRTPYQGGKNIILLGDSLVDGLGVDDDKKLASVMETQLRSDGYSYDVHNLGRSGHSIADHAADIPKYARIFQPAAIVILVGENDFIESMDSGRDTYFEQDAAGDLWVSSGNQPVSEPLAVSETFASFRPMLLVYANHRISQMKSSAIKRTQVDRPHYSGLDAELSAKQVRALLDAAGGIPLFIVNYPFDPYLSGDRIEMKASAYRKLNDLMAAHPRITYIDSVPTFRKLIDSGLMPLGFANSPTFGWGHLSGEGNRVIGSLAADVLEEVLE